jgi:hypothetical protein
MLQVQNYFGFQQKFQGLESNFNLLNFLNLTT